MTDPAARPVILLTFANDRAEEGRYLRNLPAEERRLRAAIEPAERQGLCELVVRQNVTVDVLLDVFQDPRFRHRIAVFHYGGHADGDSLSLELSDGKPTAARSEGLAAFLANQPGLALIVLNGCSTGAHAPALHRAGVPAVVATRSEIQDDVAVDFAERFFKTLLLGATIGRSFEEAAGAVLTRGTALTRDLAPHLSESAPRSSELPWTFSPREGDESAAEWCLADTASPLYFLPRPVDEDLPGSPYRDLSPYESKHWEIYFGRDAEVRELYDMVMDPAGAPLVFFYGQSGAGKSSLLDAGLAPRLRAAGVDVLIAHRDERAGLLGGCLRAFDADLAVSSDLGGLWKVWEGRTGRPLTLILDQLEEVYTRPAEDRPGELSELIAATKAVFARRAERPRGKLILGFRKEWLPELKKRFADAEMFPSEVFLETIGRDGLEQVIKGPTLRPRLKRHFRLEVSPGLVERIAGDLLSDRKAPIAPTLQILMGALWQAVEEAGKLPRVFDEDLYDTLKGKDHWLERFLDDALLKLEKKDPQAVKSGLALDLLKAHTTSTGTAEVLPAADLRRDYSRVEARATRLVRLGIDELKLLASVPLAGAEASSRLVHDTLAPLIRARFEASDLPGQRARRILENRAGAWTEGHHGDPLDEADLRTVEAGRDGMRHLSPAEDQLVAASRKRRFHRRLARGTLLAMAAVALSAILATSYWAISAGQRETIARGQAELRLAESFVRAIGQSDGRMPAAEISTLYSLAALPPENERVRLMYLAQALEYPNTAAQLSNRLAPAVQAAVGLSVRRRRRVLDEIVLPRLRRPETHPAVRWALIRVGIELRAEESEFGALAGAELTRLIDESRPGERIDAIVLATRLPGESGFPTIERFAAKLLQNPTSTPEKLDLGAGGEFVGAAGVDHLLDLLMQAPATQKSIFPPFALPILNLASRFSRAKAIGRALSSGLEAMRTATAPSYIVELAKVLAPFMEDLSPEQAWDASQIILDKLALRYARIPMNELIALLPAVGRLIPADKAEEFIQRCEKVIINNSGFRPTNDDLIQYRRIYHSLLDLRDSRLRKTIARQRLADADSGDPDRAAVGILTITPFLGDLAVPDRVRIALAAASRGDRQANAVFADCLNSLAQDARELTAEDAERVYDRAVRLLLRREFVNYPDLAVAVVIAERLSDGVRKRLAGLAEQEFKTIDKPSPSPHDWLTHAIPATMGPAAAAELIGHMLDRLARKEPHENRAIDMIVAAAVGLSDEGRGAIIGRLLKDQVTRPEIWATLGPYASEIDAERAIALIAGPGEPSSWKTIPDLAGLLPLTLRASPGLRRQIGARLLDATDLTRDGRPVRFIYNIVVSLDGELVESCRERAAARLVDVSDAEELVQTCRLLSERPGLLESHRNQIAGCLVRSVNNPSSSLGIGEWEQLGRYGVLDLLDASTYRSLFDLVLEVNKLDLYWAKDREIAPRIISRLPEPERAAAMLRLVSRGEERQANGGPWESTFDRRHYAERTAEAIQQLFQDAPATFLADSFKGPFCIGRVRERRIDLVEPSLGGNLWNLVERLRSGGVSESALEAPPAGSPGG